jgi:hypothetical protein
MLCQGTATRYVAAASGLPSTCSPVTCIRAAVGLALRLVFQKRYTCAGTAGRRSQAVHALHATPAASLLSRFITQAA